MVCKWLLLNLVEMYYVLRTLIQLRLIQTKNPVIDLMEDQKGIKKKGGTMRLGLWDCKLSLDSLCYSIYQSEKIEERHRHRYELNNDYLDKLQANGLFASGMNENTNLVEIVEIKEHPWFVGVQFHPEYKSTVLSPHPLFVSFINASKKNVLVNGG